MSESTTPNPYAAPTSNLQEAPSNSQVPTIEEALSRGYDFSIGDLIGEAWQRVKGTKGIIFGGFLVFYVVMLVATTVIGAIFGVLGLAAETSVTGMIVGQLIVSVLASALTYPFLAGINMVGIRRAADQPVSFNEVFSGLSLFVPLLITALIMSVLVYIGTLLLIIPGIYLGVAYMLAMPLVIERGLTPRQALEASRKAISQHWFKVFGLFLLLGIIMAISMIPLGIGLVWTLPLFIISMGVLYRTIFGVLPPSN
ncbi:integral membrane protein [Pseudomonas sp. ML96]|uniref:integral membrane protein n=1 Tax=Pseudomonas sp. ML96 TaxID=1523503 RepID=UPI0005B97E22|nr:integral membrane protein [Pseudomonas sp. ML96]